LEAVMLTLLRLLVTIAFGLAPLASEAQTGNRVYQIGWLTGTAVSAPEGLEAFRQSLRDFGWVEGRNYVLVFRHGDGQPDQLAQRAAELVKMKVDVIVATVPAALAPARDATSTIPIVMVYGPDPAAAGVVSSLARPGGNVTGLTSLSVDLAVKQLELLKEMVPQVSRVGVLWNPANPWHAIAIERVEATARGLRMSVRNVSVRSPGDLSAAFATMAQEHVGALLSLSDPMTFSHRSQLAQLALRHRLPMMSGVTEYTEAGGLASYWPNAADTFRRVATYVHRILNGTRPSDLPVEQPKKFELVINLKTAKSLGVVIPTAVLARADRLIE
jgi:putative ABC transport system substrate-binding protein